MYFFITSEFSINEGEEFVSRNKEHTREYDIEENDKCAKTSAHGKLLFCEITELIKNLNKPFPQICDCCGRFVFDEEDGCFIV